MLQKNISEIVGLDGMTPEEQAVFLSDVGNIIIESSVMRLLSEMNDEQVNALNHFIETDPEPDVLMDHLIKHHKSFQNILDEETVAFKEECITVLGKGALEEIKSKSGSKKMPVGV